MAKMKTESLAVQYRPRNLTDLIGQDHISKQVLGMFKSGKMPSSIMLHGSTGLGKTTVARILTRMINCSAEERDENFTPCGECPSCRMTEHPDVLELNAAEARGIDDVRNLIQQSKNMPSLGNKRIFILDEVHQLTTQAQQCLPGDMVVATPLGDVAINDLSPGDEVYSFNHSTLQTETSVVVATQQMGTKELLEIELSDGGILRCTPDHKVWSESRNSYIRADELTLEDELRTI